MRVKLLIILIAFLSINNYSQESTLFGRALPEDIYYDLDGSWRFDLSSAIKGDPSEVFKNFIFEMTPDLRASIWLYNKFFFETEITEISENNLFLFGYQSSDLGLQEVRLGNSELNIEEYAGYKPPESEEFNPGTRAKYATENTTQELLVRYSKEVLESVKYIGKNLVQEESIPVSSYIRGKFFVVPLFSGSEVLYTYSDSLEVLDRSSYIYYDDKKLLYISADVTNLYISGSSTSNLGSSDLETINIDGKELLTIYKRGNFSPIEFLGAYQLESEPGDNNDLLINGNKLINYETLDNILILYDYSLSNYSTEIKYPLIELDPEIYTSGLEVPINIYFRNLTETDSIILDDDTMENSFYITINGVYFTDYTFDSDSKTLTINRELSPFDVVEINYRNSSDNGNGNLLGVYGGSFNITDRLKLELSTAGNWSFTGDDFTDEIDESSASLDMSGELIYSSNIVQGSIKGELSLINPDTSKGFELFNYDTQKTLLLPSELILSRGEDGNRPLITREGNFILDSLENLETLEINGLDSPYIISYRNNNKTDNIIVFEVPELENGDLSSGRIGLDEESGDYSSYNKLIISLAGEVEREVLIKFITGDGSFTKEVTTGNSLLFEEVTIDFDYSQRQSLKYLESIDFTFSQGESGVTLIKDINFQGDRVWTYDSSGTIYLSEDGDSLQIRNIDSEEILVETIINNFHIENYKSVELSIANSGVITETSLIEIEILSSTGKSKSFTLGPGIEEQSYIKLNVTDGETLINSSGENKIKIKITDTLPGTLNLSPIILKDPIYNLKSEYSGDILINSDLKIKINDLDFISLDTIYSNGIYSSENYIVNGGITGNLLLGEYTLEGGYIEESTILSYSYLFPNINFPIYLLDSFTFNGTSSRENSIEVDTDNFKLKYILSNYRSELSIIRENNLESSLSSVVDLEVTGKLIQKSDGDGEPILEDITTSYPLLIPKDELNRENNFNGTILLGSTLSLYTPSLVLEGGFNQRYNNLYSIETQYKGEFNNSLNLALVDLNLFISSDIDKQGDNSEKRGLSQGYEEFVQLFQEDNPYINIDFPTLFINETPLDGYDLSNEIGFSIELENINNKYNFLIPSGGNFSMIKEGDINGDLTSSSRSYSGGIDFKFNNVVKNSGTVIFKEGLLNIEDNLSIVVDTLILWEINSDDTLDITNSYTYSDLGFTNLTEVDYSWLGKSGPLYIVPIADLLIDSPYKYTHTERGYFLFGDDTYKIGLRHESKLEILDTNETEGFIDVIYEDNENEPFSFSLGINTTLIF